MGGSRGGDRGSGPPGKSLVALGLLRNTGEDSHHPRKAIGPKPPREAIGMETSGPIGYLGRFVWPSVKYVDDLKSCQDPPPLTEFSGSTFGTRYQKFCLAVIYLHTVCMGAEKALARL